MQFNNYILIIRKILNDHFLNTLFFSTFIVFILISILRFNIFDINPVYFVYSGLFFGYISFFLWFKKLDKENIIKKILTEFSLSLFIMSLLLISLFNFNSLFIYYNLPQNTNLILIFIAIISGITNFFSNEKKIEQEINKEKNNELKIEKKRSLEFLARYPKINKIILLKNIMKWVYVEGLQYSINIIIIFVLGLILRFWNLGNLSYWVDESPSILAAKNLIYSGIPYYDGNLIYLRAIIYTLFNAITILLFGLSEFTIRLTPLLFSILSLIAIYIILKKETNKNIALLGFFIFSISDYALLYARYNRFYIALSFGIIINIYFFYLGFIENKNKYKIFSIFTAFIICGLDAKSVVFLPILLSFLLIKKFKENKEINFKIKNIFKIIFKTKLLLLYIIISILSFLFFNKLDSVNTLSGGSVRTFSEKRFILGFHLPNFIQELIYPEWSNFFFDFIYKYYPLIFIGITIFSLLLIIKIIYNKSRLNFKDLLIYYLIINLLFLSKYAVNVQFFTWDQRHLSFLFPLMIINLFLFVFYFLKILKLNFYLKIFFLTFIIYNISPIEGIIKVINMNYGDNLQETRYQVMAAEPYRSDYKTPFEYVNNNLELGDVILISKTKFQELYLDRGIAYNFFDEDGDNLEEIIKKLANKKVWVIDVNYDMNKYHAKYRWGKSYYFMENHKKNIVYYGLDKKTRVFLFKN